MTAAVGLADPGTLLAAWEEAADASGHRRGPALAAALGAVAGADALDLPLDRLGAVLAANHVAAFGRRIAGMLTCRECATELDVEVDLVELVPAAERGRDGDSPRPVGPGRLTVRVPTARDLIAAGDSADPAAEIVYRCVRHPGGEPANWARLDTADRTAVDDELARQAGPGLPTLRTTCPACAAAVMALVDPGVLLWAAVRAGATSVLQDVADLAAAFGWREADVLALPPRRRAAYLQLAER